MPAFFSRQLHSTLIILGLAGYTLAKEMPDTTLNTKLSSLTESGPSPLLAQAMFAGPAPGLAADSNLLGVFNVYSNIINPSISDKENSASWNYLESYLRHASMLDPYFYDVYRLSSGLLAFQSEHTRDAITIMKHGAEYRPWDWETPLIAGFLAHDLLQDNRLAFDLMKLATSRPGAPPLAIGLAARFLADAEDNKTGLQFLHYMKSIMPKGYAKPIDERIKKLEQEWGTEP